MEVYEKIKLLLKNKNMTQKQLADKCKLTEAAISKYVNNERIPRFDVLVKMAKAFDVGVEYFAEEKITTFKEIKSLVARNANELTQEERFELMDLLMQTRK